MKVKKNNETPFPLKTHNHPLRRKTQNTRRINAKYTENALKVVVCFGKKMGGPTGRMVGRRGTKSLHSIKRT